VDGRGWQGAALLADMAHEKAALTPGAQAVEHLLSAWHAIPDAAGARGRRR